MTLKFYQWVYEDLLASQSEKDGEGEEYTTTIEALSPWVGEIYRWSSGNECSTSLFYVSPCVRIGSQCEHWKLQQRRISHDHIISLISPLAHVTWASVIMVTCFDKGTTWDRRSISSINQRSVMFLSLSEDSCSWLYFEMLRLYICNTIYKSLWAIFRKWKQWTKVPKMIISWPIFSWNLHHCILHRKG